jgi:hypothetical protein
MGGKVKKKWKEKGRAGVKRIKEKGFFDSQKKRTQNIFTPRLHMMAIGWLLKTPLGL